jgi:hypothetical protein
VEGITMQIKYPEIGVCGLSCRLCPSYHAQGESRCGGCKSASRMAVGCQFITCAVKKKGVEFCWACEEGETCAKWHEHRKTSQKHDSFVCYQKLEDNIAFIQRDGVKPFEKTQKAREQLLRTMLDGFNEGRSKTYYSIAATVLEIEELKAALSQAKAQSRGLGLKEKSLVLHSLLDEIAKHKRYTLKLRKYKD